MSSKRVYNIADRVFAVRQGHPIWPAKISCIQGKNKSQIRYTVDFYGTNESGECAFEELFPYEEIMIKFKKLPKNPKLKFKNLGLALKESENDCETFDSMENKGQVIKSCNNNNFEVVSSKLCFHLSITLF